MRRILPLLLVVLTLGVLGAGGYLGYRLLVDGPATPDEGDVARAAAQVEESVDEDVIDTVRETVAEAHGVLNEQLGFDRVDRVDFAEFEEEHGRPVRERIDEVLRELDDDVLRRDLGSVQELLVLGAEREDNEALSYAHRILHDLDHFAFNPDEEDANYWAATITLEGEDNEAQQYLAELRG